MAFRHNGAATVGHLSAAEYFAEHSANDETAYGLLNAIDLADQNENLAVGNADNWGQFVCGDNPQLL